MRGITKDVRRATEDLDLDFIRRRISATFKNRQFRTSVKRSGDRNWLHIDVEKRLMRY